MSRIYHEIFLLERIVRRIFFPCTELARCLAEKFINLQIFARKSGKILVRNAFFPTREIYIHKGTRVLKTLEFDNKKFRIAKIELTQYSQVLNQVQLLIGIAGVFFVLKANKNHKS